MAMPEQDNEELVRQGYEALNERDPDSFRAAHADDVVIHDHDEEVHGIDTVVDQQWGFIEAFPNLDYSMGDILAEGELVAARHTATGTHASEFQGIPPTGQEVEIPVMFRVGDDEIAEGWLNYAPHGLMQQFGVVESPSE